jgi:SAM-dependent methyltransferase
MGPNCIHCETNNYVKYYFEYTIKNLPYKVPGKYKFYNCRKCGLVFQEINDQEKQDVEKFKGAVKNDNLKDLNKSYKESFVESIDIFDKEIATPVYWKNREKITDYLITLIEKDIGKLADKKDYSILEIGCADGFLLQRIKEINPFLKLTGIDPSPIMTARAKANGLNVLHGTLDTIKVGEKKFDLVICLGNLMLHPNPFRTLSFIHEVLKSGGVLIFDVKNNNNSFRWIARFLCRIRGIHKIPGINIFVNKLAGSVHGGMRYFFSKKNMKKYVGELHYSDCKISTTHGRSKIFGNPDLKIKNVVSSLFFAIDDILDCRAWLHVTVKKLEGK